MTKLQGSATDQIVDRLGRHCSINKVGKVGRSQRSSEISVAEAYFHYNNKWRKAEITTCPTYTCENLLGFHPDK